MNSATLEQANQHLLYKQHLVSVRGETNIVDLVEEIFGLHATNPTTPFLSLLARWPAFDKSRLDKAMFQEWALARIRCVRKTIYIQSRRMYPVLHAATSKPALTASRRFMDGRGVDQKAYDRLSRDILALLADGPLPAADIRKALQTDLDISPVLYYMCDSALLVRAEPLGGWKDRSHSYRIFRECFPDLDLAAMNEEAAISTIARWYIETFGPVSVEDIIWWIGIGANKIRRAIESMTQELLKIDIKELGAELLMLELDWERMASRKSESPRVHLLPTLDGYLMGYRSRKRFLDDEDRDYVIDRSGNATSTILASGRIIGVWDYSRKAVPVVRLHFFREPARLVKDAVLVAAERTGRFIFERDCSIEIIPDMVPLTERTAGAMMTPLKEQ